MFDGRFAVVALFSFLTLGSLSCQRATEPAGEATPAQDTPADTAPAVAPQLKYPQGGHPESPAEFSFPEPVDNGVVILGGPTLQGAERLGVPASASASGPSAQRAFPNKAYAFHYNTHIFDRPHKTPEVRGILRRGSWLPASEQVFGPGCKKGGWFSVPGKGYVCTALGVAVAEELPSTAAKSPQPDLAALLPYRYFHVSTPGAPLFKRSPTAEQLDRSRKGVIPEYVEKRMVGDYFLAKDSGDDMPPAVLRTVNDRYVAASDVTELPLPPMHGLFLNDEVSLPVAFVGTEETPLFCPAEGGWNHCGHALLHARFPVSEEIAEAGDELVVSADKFAVARSAVKIARAIERPKKIPKKAKWIHVDLTNQVLVAYEDKTPVFATLVSSGKAGYDTPKGTFRIRKKFVTITMDGRDPVDGVYDVAEVPWTMYYFKSYALHGAYWHNQFGTPRSHGCTNIAPADAKWLFYWTTPQVPERWHGIRMAEGTFVHLTR